jgi:hypothetical protein
MPIIKKNDIAPERPVIMVLYGVPGSGKTSIASTSKNPLLIDTDRGYDRSCLRVDTLTANKWEDILNEKNAGTFKGYSTIIVDTAKAALDDYLSTYVLSLDYKLERNSLKRFGAMGDNFKLFVNDIRNGGADIIFICHDKETQDGDIIRHSPDCTGQSKDLLIRIADQVGYISFKNGKRTITFQPTDNYVSKNVAGLDEMVIPDVTDAEFSTFMADIIAKTRAEIQGHSEAQRLANEKLQALREELSKADTDKKIAKLIKDCAELPQVMKAPFFMEMKKVLAERGFVYNKDANAFVSDKPKEEKPKETGDEEKSDNTEPEQQAPDKGDNA